MQRKTLLLICCIITLTSCRTTKPVAENRTPAPELAEGRNVENQTAVNYSDQASWLLGFFNLRQLKSEPHSAWFYKGYDDYRVNAEALRSLFEIGKEGLCVKIVMGTWCPDSRREVPRFMKVLDSWKFPAESVTFIGVDNEKLSPVGDYKQLEIHRVPTFIIYKNNIEQGRIIENPVTSLEQDMVNILKGMNNNK